MKNPSPLLGEGRVRGCAPKARLQTKPRLPRGDPSPGSRCSPPSPTRGEGGYFRNLKMFQVLRGGMRLSAGIAPSDISVKRVIITSEKPAFLPTAS